MLSREGAVIIEIDHHFDCDKDLCLTTIILSHPAYTKIYYSMVSAITTI